MRIPYILHAKSEHIPCIFHTSCMHIPDIFYTDSIQIRYCPYILYIYIYIYIFLQIVLQVTCNLPSWGQHEAGLGSLPVSTFCCKFDEVWQGWNDTIQAWGVSQSALASVNDT
jgi:hypothetical protein